MSAPKRLIIIPQTMRDDLLRDNGMKAKITISVGKDKAIQEFPVNLKPEKVSAAMKRAILSAIRALGVKTKSTYKP